jgi:hypothetical protein
MAGRALTGGETALARAAFGNRVAYGGVRLIDGPDTSFAAHIAFMRGNTAITLGSDVHFRLWYTADFAGPQTNAGLFIHEMTHVWQYAALGQGPFFARYGEELTKVGFKADQLYKYKAGKDLFTAATLEAQAQMVEDYSRALWGKHAARTAELAKNLAGSGVYGL